MPKTTEIYLSAEDDSHALSNFKKLDLTKCKFHDDTMKKLRVTFEIVKDVQIENATHRTVDRFKE